MSSNYAKALKHIALRGRASVGLTAAEQEIRLYKRSFLPADYAPPKIDKWEDMMERWTHAWQHPVADNIETPSRHVVKEFRQNMYELADFLKSVAQNPPFLRTSDDRCLPLLPKSVPQAQLAARKRATDEAPTASPQKEDTSKPYLELVPGEPIAEEGVPVAYVDVLAPITVYAKELCIHLADAGMSFDEEGVKTAIRALGLIDRQADALFLFDFGRAIGLAGQSIVAYNALAATYNGAGSAEAVMGVIERAKANGITPNVVTWNILITRMSNVGDARGAIQVFSHMKALANIEPNEEVITSMLWVYANEGSDESVQKCLELFDQMQTTLDMIPMRQSYTAVLFALRHRKSRTTEILEYAKKMELIGYHWTPIVYECLMANHACTGNLPEIRKLHGRMRENGVAMGPSHLYPVLEALRHQSEEGEKDVAEFWASHLRTGWGVLRLIQKRAADITEEKKCQRTVEIGFDGLLRLYETAIEQLKKKYPNELQRVDPLKQGAVELYAKGPFEDGVRMWDRRVHVNYMKVLAHFPEERARVTALFQQVLKECAVQETRQSRDTLYRACVVLIKMHLRSGEEGGTRKALEYIELMENHNMPPSRRLIREIRTIADDAGYIRDMKRRGRRMQQAQEAHREKGGENSRPGPPPAEESTCFDPLQPLGQRDVASLKDFVAMDEASGNAAKSIDMAKTDTSDVDSLPALTPVPPTQTGGKALTFWDRWTQNTISKHELFDGNGADAVPKGETLEEKNAALRKMGVISKFVTVDDLPKPGEHKLLGKLRKDGTEPTGALWAIDGSGYSYPASRQGSFGWDVTLWRERQVIKKAYEDSISSSKLSWLKNIPTSLPSTLQKTVPEQLELETTGAKTAAEIADSRAYPFERYDAGGVKPTGEHASPVAPAEAYAWEKEKSHPLVPYMTEDEIGAEMGYMGINALVETGTLGVQAHMHAQEMAQRTVETLEKAPTEIIAYGASHGLGESKVAGYKNRKYDYLQRFKEMYQRGQLEVPEEPLVRFGQSPSDATSSTAASVEAFYRASAVAQDRGEGHAVKPQTEARAQAKRGRVRIARRRKKLLKKRGVQTRGLQSPAGTIDPHE